MSDSIRQLYRDVLGREADDGGLNHFLDALNAGASLTSVRLDLAYSQEAANDIDGFYRQVAWRPATSDEISLFQNALYQGGDWNLGSVRWNIAHTDAAAAGINGIYQQMLGHPSYDPDLFAAYENNMGWGWTLGDVRWDLAHRPEAAGGITTIYQQILGRDPNATELSIQEGNLSAGHSLGEVRGIAYGAEAAANIGAAFRNEWGVEAQAGDYAYWENTLAQGSSIQAIRTAFAYAPQATNAIDGIYRQMLGHGSDDPGLLGAYEYNLANYNWTLADVRWDLAHRPEAADGITTIYRQIVGRDPNATELSIQEGYLAQGHSLSEIRGIAYSAEAAADIDTMYRQTLGRGADSGGTSVYENLLAQGWSQSDVRRSLGFSGEAAADIDGIYRQVAWRGATPDEIALFQNALSQGGDWNQGSLRWNIAHTDAAAAGINGIYQQMLGHPSYDPDLFAAYENNMGWGWTLGDVRWDLAHRPEATSVITTIYQQVLGRNPIGAEIAVYEDNVLAQGGTPGGIRTALATSSEAAANIGAAFRNEWGVEAQAGDYAYWENTLAQGSSIQAIRTAFAYAPQATDAINGIYQQMLGHGSDDPGLLGAYEYNLANYNWTLADVRWDLAHRPEARDLIVNTYLQELGRAPGEGEIKLYADNALAQGWSLAQFRGVVGNSSESASAIATIYHQVLGREPELGAVGVEQAALIQGDTLGAFRHRAATSLEANNDIAADFRNELGREAQGGDFAYWEDALERGTATFQSMRTNFSQMPEAVAGITSLYRQVLDRDPIPAEIAVYQDNVLAQGGSLANIRVALATSSGAASAIDGFYRAMAGRAATPDEIALFQNALGQGGDWNLGSVRWNIAHTDAVRDAINGIYQQMLGHPSNDPGLLAAYENNLGAAGWTLADVRWDLAHRPEARDLIVNTYLQELGRAPGEGEIKLYADNALAQGWSLAQFRGVVGNSSESASAIATIYHQVLGREPELGAVGVEQAALIQGDTLGAFRHRAATSLEANNDIAADFRNELGREAQGGDFAYWEDALERGTATFQSMRSGFSQMPEAVAGITNLYRQVLGRDPIPAEVAVYQDNVLAQGGSLANIRVALATSSGAASAIDGIYRQRFGRAATQPEIAEGQAALSGTLTLAGFGAWLDSGTTAAVNRFYQDLFGRDALGPEADNIRAAMAAGQTLAQVLAYLRPIFASSSYEAAQANALYQRLFGRDAEPGEVASFETAIANGQSLAQVEDFLTQNLAYSDYEGAVVSNTFQQVLGHGPAPDDLFDAEDALAAGMSLSEVRNAVAHSSAAGDAIDAVYRQVLGRGATAAEIENREAELAGTGTLASLRYAQAHSAEMATEIDHTYHGLFGHGVDPSSLSVIEQQITDGASLSQYRRQFALDPNGTVPGEINAAFNTYLGRAATGTEMAYWQDRIADGLSIEEFTQPIRNYVGLDDNYNQIYYTNVDYYQAIGYDPATDKLRGYAPAFTSLTLVGADGATIAVNSARDLLALLPVYVTMYGGQTPNLVLADGRFVAFDNAEQLADYLVRTAQHTAIADPLLGNAYDATTAWLQQVDQPALQAGIRYAKMVADIQAGRTVGDTYILSQANVGREILAKTASALAFQVAEQDPVARHGLSARVHQNGHDTIVSVGVDGAVTFHDIDPGIFPIIEAVVTIVVDIASIYVPALRPIAVVIHLAEAGQSFSNGNVLGGVLNLASAASIGLAALGATRAAQIVAAASAVTGGVGHLVEGAENGDLASILGGVLLTASGVASGLGLPRQSGIFANGSTYQDLSKLLAAAGALTSFGASIAQGDVVGGLVNSLGPYFAQIAAGAIASGAASSITRLASQGALEGSSNSATYPDADNKIGSYAGTATQETESQSANAAAGAVGEIGPQVLRLPPGVLAVGESLLTWLAGRALSVLGGATVASGAAVAAIFYSSPTGNPSDVIMPDGTLIRSSDTAQLHVFFQNNEGSIADKSGLYRNSNGDIVGIVLKQNEIGQLSTIDGMRAGSISSTKITFDEGFLEQAKVGNIFTSSSTESTRPPNLAPEGASQSEALEAIKAAHNIPAGESPEILPNKNEDNSNRPGSEILRYIDRDGNIVDIRHDYDGHRYSDDPNQDREPHFNWDNPLTGKSDHYDYRGAGEPFGILRR